MSSVGTLDQAVRPPRSRWRPNALSRAAFTIGTVAAALGALALIGKYLPQSGLTPLHSKLTDKGMVALFGIGGVALASGIALRSPRRSPRSNELPDLSRYEGKTSLTKDDVNAICRDIREYREDIQIDDRKNLIALIPTLCNLAEQNRKYAENLLGEAEGCALEAFYISDFLYAQKLVQIAEVHKKIGSVTSLLNLRKSIKACVDRLEGPAKAQIQRKLEKLQDS